MLPLTPALSPSEGERVASGRVRGSVLPIFVRKWYHSWRRPALVENRRHARQQARRTEIVNLDEDRLGRRRLDAGADSPGVVHLDLFWVAHAEFEESGDVVQFQVRPDAGGFGGAALSIQFPD